MKFTVKNPPKWLKGKPLGAIALALSVYQAKMSKDDDQAKAKDAALEIVNTFELLSQNPGNESQRFIPFRAAKQTDEKGLVWEVILIAPGLSDGYPQFYWSEEILSGAIEKFKGIDVNAYEIKAELFTHLPIPDIGPLEDVKRYLTTKKVGWVEGQGVVATIHILPEQKWLADTLRQGIDAGNPDVLGLSIDAMVKGFEVNLDGYNVLYVSEIGNVSSVDVVTHPAAGGKFLRAVAAKNINMEVIMNREALLKMIAEARPDLLTGKNQADLKDEEVIALAQMAMKPTEDKPGAVGAGMTSEQVQELIDKGVADSRKEIEARAACARTLDAALAESELPILGIKRVRQDFEGKIFEQKELDTAIKFEKDYMASMAKNIIPDTGDQTRNVGLGSIQKIQIACDRAFGLDKKDFEKAARMSRLDGKPFFGDIRAGMAKDFDDASPGGITMGELYVLLTGDTEVRGVFNRAGLSGDIRAAQDITSSTFSYVLGNTMSRRLVKDYKEANFHEDLLISIKKSVKDFRQQEALLIGGFGDLDTVDPESGDYVEISAVTDEESTYSVGQKGNILTITRKTIINDDLSVIMRLVSRLGRAARRTLAQYVWNFFLNNSNCSDGTAWFTSGHGNLGAAAMSFANVLVAFKALAKMTEKDSGKRIGLLDDPSMKPTLIYPVDVMETGEQIVNDEHYYTANDLTTKTRNPMKGKINGAQVSMLTDTNDWGLLMPAQAMDMVEMGFLNGREEPEMFVADTPQSEQVFVADKVRYKIRHEYAGTVVDYRTGYKAIVA